MGKQRTLSRPIPGLLASIAVVALTGISTAKAGELIYYPTNPSFGGNPLNGSVLLNSALATNKHTDPDADRNLGLGRQSSLQSFNDSLERAVLSQLASAATGEIMGTDGTLRPGRVETGNFLINIVDLGSGVLQITTTDKLLGTSTSFQVGK